MVKNLCVILVTFALFVSTGFASSRVSNEEQDSAVILDPRAMSSLFADIVEQVSPSVVTITTKNTVTTSASQMMPWDFGFSPYGSGTREYVQEGLGSGVIINSNGLIVTNNHVAGDVDELLVILPNGDEVEAKLIGSDPRSDIALIKIDYSQPLEAIAFGDSDEIRVGEWVLAIGSPFALSQTVTQGIVSFLGRNGVGLADYENYIQTDAAINPGNSGGALVDLSGKLIGINTAIASRSGGYQGIGFAIPSNTALDVVNELLEFGEVRRGWLGVSIQVVNENIAEQFEYFESKGVLISDIVPESPADNSELNRGDIVTEVNGVPFETLQQFRNMIADLNPEETVDLTVFRDGRLSNISVRLGKIEEDPQISSAILEEDYGLVLSELTDELLGRLQASDLQGVVVLNVYPGSPGAMAGFIPGDVILEVNREAVESPTEVNIEIDRTVGEALFLVWRSGRTLFIVM